MPERIPLPLFVSWDHSIVPSPPGQYGSALSTSTSATLRPLRNRLSLRLNTHMLPISYMPSLRPLTGDREQAGYDTHDVSLFVKNRNQPTAHITRPFCTAEKVHPAIQQ